MFHYFDLLRFLSRGHARDSLALGWPVHLPLGL